MSYFDTLICGKFCIDDCGLQKNVIRIEAMP